MAKLAELFKSDIELQKEIREMFLEILEHLNRNFRIVTKRLVYNMIGLSLIGLVIVVLFIWFFTTPSRDATMIYNAVQNERKMNQNLKDSIRQLIEIERREKDTARMYYYRDSMVRAYNDSIEMAIKLNSKTKR